MNLVASYSRTSKPPIEPAVGISGEGHRTPIVRQYMRIAMRWRYVIIAAIGCCLALGMVITLLMTPKYTAVSTIEISRESDRVTDFQGVEREASVADQEFYQTQYGLLQARSLAERVATQLKLVDDPSFFSMFGVSRSDPAFEQINGRYTPAGRPVRRRVAADVLLKNLDVTPTRLSRLVDIYFTSPRPDFSEKVANAWGENFIQSNLERKIQATSYGRNLLQRQLGQLKEKLDESQRQLVAYASEQKIINLPAQSGGEGTQQERSMVADDLATLNGVLARATAARIQAEARYKQGEQSGVSSASLDNVAVNQLREKRAELTANYQKLMIQFKPEYPAAQAIKSQIDQIDRSIAFEERHITKSFRSDYLEAVDRERGLQDKVNQLKSSYLDLRRRSIQYNIYQQEVDSNRALYDGILQRFKEIGVEGGVGVNNVSVVDGADTPQHASSPKLIINLALSLLAGLIIGGGLALVLEQMDEAFTDPTEVEDRLGLSLLGTVPRVDGVTPKEALLDRKSDLVDAYLAVQTNLAFTTEHGAPRSFAVTSTRPAEGKSTTALALATTLARGQRRVILVDGDMRAPSVHQLGGTGHLRGLSNFLSGDDDIASLLFQMSDLGITAMSAGPIPPNAAELLTGNRLSILISRLLETYDNIVIDSPPVMGLADAPLIASRVEGVVYAVESHGVRASTVRTALARLATANVRIMGCVLTKFDAKKAHYGYGYEYGYDYGRKRTSEEEVSGV